MLIAWTFHDTEAVESERDTKGTRRDWRVACYRMSCTFQTHLCATHAGQDDENQVQRIKVGALATYLALFFSCRQGETEVRGCCVKISLV